MGLVSFTDLAPYEVIDPVGLVSFTDLAPYEVIDPVGLVSFTDLAPYEVIFACYYTPNGCWHTTALRLYDVEAGWEA